MAFIPAGKFRRYWGQSWWRALLDIKTLFLNIRDFFRTLAGIARAYKVLKGVRPNVVFSKGGFVAVPVGIAARLHNVPIITHDSDSLPGLANKIIGRWAEINTVGALAGSYPYPKKKLIYTGIPIDENIKPVTDSLQKKYKVRMGLPENSEVVLVGGGGLGSRDINNRVISISRELLSKRLSLYLVHIAGEKHSQEVISKYKQILTQEEEGRLKVLGFTDQFYKYTAAADLVVTRAGATVLAELAAQNKACIIIPAPFLAGGHQLRNVERLKKLSAVEVLTNDDEPKKLLNLIETLMQNKQRRLELAKKFGSTAEPQAAKNLAKIILDLAKGKAIEDA